MRYLLLALLLLLPEAQSINFFSPKQDIEMGKASADEAEKQITLVRSNAINQYIHTIGLRLLPNSTLHQVHYEYHIVDSLEINSLGFPNGSIYLYRGLLNLATNDDEVAAMLAHEIGHITSRHATSQLSRQLLVQAPISVSSGLPTMDTWKEQLTRLGVVFGVNAPFLHYSPGQEVEATSVASRMLAAARFDPSALTAVFEKVRGAGKKSDAPVPLFLYNHPLQDDSLPDKTEAAPHIKVSPEFRTFHTALLKLPRPHAAASDASGPDEGLTNTFTHAFYQLNYPDTWQVRPMGKDGTIIAPPDGIRTSPTGDDITHGVIADMFDLSTVDKPLTLEQATNRVIVSLRQRNQSLQAIPGAQTPILIHDEPGLRTVLLEKSAVTGSDELVWVVTRMYYQNMFYLVFVAPEEDFPARQAVFEKMIRSLQMR